MKLTTSMHHRILLGESPDSLVEIAQIKNLETNIVTPKKLKPDTLLLLASGRSCPNGKAINQTGDLWQFSTDSE